MRARSIGWRSGRLAFMSVLAVASMLLPNVALGVVYHFEDYNVDDFGMGTTTIDRNDQFTHAPVDTSNEFATSGCSMRYREIRASS